MVKTFTPFLNSVVFFPSFSSVFSSLDIDKQLPLLLADDSAAPEENQGCSASEAGSGRFFTRWLKRDFSQHIPAPTEHPALLSGSAPSAAARRLTGLRCSSPPALGARDHSKEEVTCATSGVRKEFVNVALTRGISLGRFLFSSSLEPRCSQPCLSCSPHPARSESPRTVFPS